MMIHHRLKRMTVNKQTKTKEKPGGNINVNTKEMLIETLSFIALGSNVLPL